MVAGDIGLQLQLLNADPAPPGCNVGKLEPKILDPIVDQILRSGRRTIGLEIDQRGRLLLRVPRWTSDDEIRDVLRRKRAWILKHKLRSAAHHADDKPLRFRDGDTILYLGQPRTIHVAKQQEEFLAYRDDGFQLVADFPYDRRELFVNWYISRARRILTERTRKQVAAGAREPKSLSVTKAARRWGSCSAKGAVNFAWRIIMAPMPVIDYVVAHELAHLREFNHSPAFWNAVAEIIPDYRQHRAWLKQHGPELNF